MTIRIAGNTYIPCFYAIKAKGYKVEVSYVKGENGEYNADWLALKNDRKFSATTPMELLGLIAMWEVRGDNWHANDNELKEYDKVDDNAPKYYVDEEGYYQLLKDE